MKKLVFTCLCGLIFCFGFSQQRVVFTVQQPDSLIADAGNDQFIDSGEETTIGGIPAALGGTPPYLYSWIPADKLNNPTSPNPVTNTDSTTAFILFITDSIHCTATDTVIVYTDSTGHIINGGKNNEFPPLIFYNRLNGEITINFFSNNVNGLMTIVNLSDITGKDIFSQSITINNNFAVIKVPLLLPDIILVNIVYQNKKWSEKLIIQK